VLRLCRLLLQDPDEAEDACQDVLAKLLARGGVDLASPFLDRWLARVTVNACRDRRRSGWWRWWRMRGRDVDELVLTASDPTPEEAVVALETRREIWRAFQALSVRQQEVFALRHVHGLSTAEVASTLGVTDGSAKRHLHRAVHRLRAALEGLRR
jgi:RNA polymerase sigma-70 factor (ECF subfamily)